jgi:hypothetical protein
MPATWLGAETQLSTSAVQQVSSSLAHRGATNGRLTRLSFSRGAVGPPKCRRAIALLSRRRLAISVCITHALVVT